MFLWLHCWSHSVCEVSGTTVVRWKRKDFQELYLQCHISVAPLLELYLQCHVSVVSEKKERLPRFLFTVPCFCGTVEFTLSSMAPLLSGEKEGLPRIVFTVPCFCGSTVGRKGGNTCIYACSTTNKKIKSLLFFMEPIYSNNGHMSCSRSHYT